MKQHITQEQWDELNDEQKSKLGLFLNPIDKGMEHHWRVSHSDLYFDMNSIDIGQMIEFLLPDILCINKRLYGDITWELHCRFQEPFEYNELCDALWEAVKGRLQPDFEKKNLIHIETESCDHSNGIFCIKKT